MRMPSTVTGALRQRTASSLFRRVSIRSFITRLTASRWLMLAFCFLFFFFLLVNVDVVWHREGSYYEGTQTPVGGDFIAYYSAGQIVAAGDGADLYEWERQIAEQARTLDVDAVDTFLPFAYPAFVAAPYALLAQIPFVWAYVVTAAVMGAALLGTVALLRPVSSTVREQPALVAMGMLASQPLSQVTYSGQTVAFSLLCLAGGYSALRRDREVAAGLWLGLLLFKPQLAAPLLALLLWRRCWRTVAVAGTVGVGLALLGAAVAGPDWPWRFIDLAGGDFYASDAAVNGHNMISLLGVAEQLFEPKSAWAYTIAGTLCLGVVVFLVRAWREARPESDRFPLQYGLAVVVTLLLSPHALYYEASLLLLPILALIDHWRREGRMAGISTPTPAQRLALIVLFVAGYVWFLGPNLAVNPLAAVPLVVGMLMWRALSHGHADVVMATGDQARSLSQPRVPSSA